MTDSPFGPEPLTPAKFLTRSAVVFGDRLAIIDGDRRFTYAEIGARARRLSGALAAAGLAPGDRASVLAPNTSMHLEAHFGMPYSQVVLNSLNTRLSVGELAYIVEHAGSKILFVDEELLATGKEVANQTGVRLVQVGGTGDEYEAMLAGAEPLVIPITDETSLLSLNYTSGTTGRPKGVMYSHRGAFLTGVSLIAQAGLDAGSAFLWTLPMFHCNGWCFPWAVTAAGSVHVGLRKVDPAAIWRAIREDGVTHFNAAPTVLIDLAFHPDAGEGAPTTIRVATGGAPPSPRLLARLDELNIKVTHLYGLTETYGPSVLCEWRPEWDDLDLETRARLKARQGVGNVVGEALRVLGDDGADVPGDGETPGEVLIRGNNVMIGYYNDPAATAAATFDGWFRTGDSGVMHPDGYIELRDRLKDVIISGGENIASIEVEQAIMSHPAVLECAVVAGDDERWGEVPIAFVVLQPGKSATEAELIEHVKSRIARFKAPKQVLFDALPKTATGKIQKYVLRERLRAT
ncbi:MAG: AMP-binding protein [Acidobacteria bacterium]|nr:AMP-binding protein [Acidobacteriota bacterium]